MRKLDNFVQSFEMWLFVPDLVISLSPPVYTFPRPTSSVTDTHRPRRLKMREFRHWLKSWFCVRSLTVNCGRSACGQTHTISIGSSMQSRLFDRSSGGLLISVGRPAIPRRLDRTGFPSETMRCPENTRYRYNVRTMQLVFYFTLEAQISAYSYYPKNYYL